MKRSVKRILPALLVLLIICSIIWYLAVYDPDFTQDVLLSQARFFDDQGNHNVAAWFYDLAYQQSGHDESVAIELAEKFKETGNYTKAEVTLSNAIADGGSVDLYIALCRTYVEQNKLLDAVTMLENVTDVQIKAQLEALRPQVPVSAPAPGFYSQYITVAVQSDTGKLYVTTDKEYPSTNDAPYAAPIQLVGGENTIYALSVGDNGLVSKLAVFGYVVGGVVEDITLSDSAIDAMVRTLLNKGPEDPISSAELWTITSMELPADALTLTDLQYFPYLKSLTSENGKFQNLNGLSSLTNLTELTIRKKVLSSSDIAMIADLPNLEKLTLEDCGLSSIANLSAAKKLTDLNLSSNTIRDISVLGAMTALARLDLNKNALTDLSALTTLTGLKELDVSYNSLENLAPLGGCVGLNLLDASHNTLSALTGLDTLKGLTSLNVSYNKLTDTSLLSGSKALTYLNLSNNTISDISALAPLNNLTEFDFSHNQIAALPAFAKDCPLVTVRGSYNKLTSVDPLSGLSLLNNVILEYNSIGAVDSLASCYNLVTVNVFGNPVKDVSALTQRGVIVYYSPV